MHPSASRQKEILYLLISALIVVVCWIGFGIYNTSITSTINSDLLIQINPIDPNFDIDTLNKLKAKAQVAPVASLTGTPQLSPTPSPKASTSALLTPSLTKTATTSGSLTVSTH